MTRMKTAILICSLVVLSVQVRGEGRFGIKIGSAISNCYYTAVNSNPHSDLEIDLSPYLGYDVRWVQLAPQKALFSPYVGIYYTLQLSEKFSLRPEISYLKKGLSFSQSEYERIIYRVEIDYLEIPLSLVFKLYQGSRASSEIYFGGYGSFKIQAAKKVAYHDSPVEKIQLDSVNQMDWGIHLGAGYRRRILKKSVLFDFRLFLGFSDIFFVPGSGDNKYFRMQKTKITGAYVTIGYEL